MKKILIVGGGIGGLTAMNFLTSQGHDVHLVEKTSDFRAGRDHHLAGAGIMLGINAMKILDKLGLAKEVIEQGQALADFSIVDQKGRFITVSDSTYMEAETGYKTVGIHRGSLQSILSKNVITDRCRFNFEVTEIAQEGNDVQVTFQDDSTERFDLLIAADGIHSSIRKLLTLPSTLRYSGYTCWRFVIERPESLMASNKGYEYWGRGRRFGIVPIGASQLYCFATLNSPQNNVAYENIDLDEFKKLFSVFQGDVPSILDQMSDDTALIQGDLCDQMAVRLQENKVALLGDAAHAATPNMGQGAAMAIEDAYLLSTYLAEHDAVTDALKAYETRRVARVKLIRDRSHRVGAISQWESRVSIAIRNNMLRIMPRQGLSKDLSQLLMDY